MLGPRLPPPPDRIDHQKPWAQTRHTRLDELDPLCGFHHDLKTRRHWALVPGTGKRPFVPPDDPRHPSQQPAPERAGPAASATEAADGLGVGTYQTTDRAIDDVPAIPAAHVGARRPMTVTSSSRTHLEPSVGRSLEGERNARLLLTEGAPLSLHLATSP